MKNIILIVISFLTAASFSFSQTNTKTEENEKVYTVTEVMPQFPGGTDALLQFLSKNIKYPEEARKNNISGRVYVTFVVNKSGKVEQVRILRGIGGGCEEEVLRVMSLMPDWSPGTQDGKTVSVQYNLPVNFNLPKDEEKKREPK